VRENLTPPHKRSMHRWKNNSLGRCELDSCSTGEGLRLGPSEYGNEIVPTKASLTAEQLLGPQHGLISMVFVTEK
jgi:hypothetical protein